MNFNEIPQFTNVGGYEINVPLNFLDKRIKEWEEDELSKLQINPDFQRGHVWNEKQQINFVEYFLRGGASGRVLYFNSPSWMGCMEKLEYDEFVLVDGLQRLTALLKFLRNEIKVFGLYCSEFEGKLQTTRANMNLRINVNNLKTKNDVLTWYIEMNSGGTPHTEDEINRVKELLEK